MMGLEFVKIEELTEKVGCRKAEAPLKVSNENNELPGFGSGFHLIAWNPARYLCRYPPGAVQPIDVLRHHV
jgi:hypothetical protein